MNDKLSDYAVGCIVRIGAPGVKHICRGGFAGHGRAEDYPLASKFDEVEALVILDDVLMPWEDVFFYRQSRAAKFIRGALLRFADTAWDGIMPALYADKFDVVMSAMTITKDQAEKVMFSMPYADASNMILLRAQGNDINTADDLAGHAVGAQPGSPAARARRSRERSSRN